MKMNVDLNRIIDFIKIVESGNISKAAEVQGVGKAKLSRSLALLESEIGLQLVYRTTRQFQLTNAGLELYKKGKQQTTDLLDTIESLKNQDMDLHRMVRITAPEDVGLSIITNLVLDYKKINPKVGFDLIFTNQVLDLVQMGIDVAFRMGNLKDSSLIQKKVGRVEFIVVAAPKYLSWNQPVLKPIDLLKHQTILFSLEKTKQWHFYSQNDKVSIEPKSILIANNFLVIKEFVLQGQGIAFMPRYLCDSSIAKGELVHLLKNWRNEGAMIQVTMPQQKNISKTVRHFFDFAVKKTSEIL